VGLVLVARAARGAVQRAGLAGAADCALGHAAGEGEHIAGGRRKGGGAQKHRRRRVQLTGTRACATAIMWWYKLLL
jgi:hypothetical protein